MANEISQTHSFNAPRALVESLVNDTDIRARWAPDGANFEISGVPGHTMVSATGAGDWPTAFSALEDLVIALTGNDREISITRLIKHPVERVFAAFSDPAGMAIWWGPNGFTTTTKTMQFKVGGVWDYMMHGPDGTDYPNYVRYRKIAENTLIAYDHGTDAEHPAIFKAEISFASVGSSTRVNLKVILADAGERPSYVKFGAVEGGYQNLERLEKWLESHD